MAKHPLNTPLLPFRERKYRNLKDALRHAIYSRPEGKNAETIAMEAGLDRLSDLSRYVSDNDADQRGRIFDIFVPLLISLGDKGVEVYEFIGEELRAAQDAGRDDRAAAADKIIAQYGPMVFEALQAKIVAGKKK